MSSSYNPGQDEDDEQSLVEETPAKSAVSVEDSEPTLETQEPSGEGGLNVSDDGSVAWEGDVFKETEHAREGRDPISELAAQIPIVSSAQSIGGGIGTGLSVFIQEAVKDGFSKEDIRTALQETSEYIRHDISGGGLGRSVSRGVFGGATDLIQNVANLTQPNRKIKDGDVGIFFGDPLERVAKQTWGEELTGHVSNIAGLFLIGKYVLVPGLKAATAAATTIGPAFVTKSIASKAASQQALRASVQKILQGAASQQGNLQGIGWGNRFLWQKYLSWAGVKAVEGSIFGYAYDYAAVNRIPNGYWEQLEQGGQQWISTTPWYAPSLTRISPDDTVGEAARAEALNGLFIHGPGGNILTSGIGKGFKYANSYRRNIHIPRIEGETTAALKDNFEKGGPPIRETYEASKVRGFNQEKIQNLKEKGNVRKPLWENGLELQRVMELDDIVRNNPTKADEIIASTPPDEVVDAAMKVTGRELEKVELEARRIMETSDDTGMNAQRPDYTQTPTARPGFTQTKVESVENMVVRPQEMQYKIEGASSKRGVSGSAFKAKEFRSDLAGVVTVWRDPANGELVVVNGHNRFDLAKRSGASQMNVLEVEAPDAQTARSIGALQNIAEGMGTSYDAAKFIRDTGMSPDDLKNQGLDLGGSVVREAIPLSRLPDDLFDKVLQGKIDKTRGIALGSVEDLDPAIVRDVAKKAQKSRWSAAKIDQAMQEARFASTEEGPADLLTLIGDRRFDPKTSDFGKLIDLRTEAYRRLKEEMIALTSAARGGTRKEILEQAGNVVDVAGSRSAKDKASTALQVFNEVTAYVGPVRNILDEMAKELQPGTTAKKVVDSNLDRLRTAIQQEIEGGFNRPAPTPARAINRQAKKTPVESKAEAPALEVDPRIKALGEEPKVPEPPRGGETGFNESDAKVVIDEGERARYEKELRTYNEYWNKRDAIEEELGLLRPWDEIIKEAEEAGIDTPGLLSWYLPNAGNAGDAIPQGRAFFNIVDQAESVANANVHLIDEIYRIAGLETGIEFPDQLKGRMTLRQAMAYGQAPGTPYSASGQFLDFQSAVKAGSTSPMWAGSDARYISFIENRSEFVKDTVLVAVFNERGMPLDFRSRLSAAHHEAFHRLQMRFLTPKEMRILANSEGALRKLAARDVRGDLRTQILDGTTPMVEVEAIAFGNWWKYMDEYIVDINHPWAKPFQRIRQFLERVSNLIRGGGFKTWSDVFDEAFEGDIAKRGIRDDAYGNPFAGEARYMGEFEGGLLSVDNNSKPPNIREGGGGGGPDDANFAREFAKLYEQNREQILTGEIDAGDLWSQNNFTSVQSEAGKYVYNFQSEDLLAGMEGMSRADGRTRAELTGRPIWNGIETQKIAHEWFKRNAEDPNIGASVLRGLSSVSEGLYRHEVGALHRALDFADKLQARAQTEASKWINAASNPNIDQRVQLARLVVSADSARRMHIAIANITRRWSHLGLEMQLPRDIDTYQIPDNYRLPDVSDIPEAKGRGAGPGPGGGVVDSALREELQPLAGTNSVMDEFTSPFSGLNESLRTGIIDFDAQVAGDAIADSLLIMGDAPSSRSQFWTKWNRQGYGKNKEDLGKAIQMVKSSNLISSGITASKGIMNGVFNLSQLTLSQSMGGLLAKDTDRALFGLQMFGNYWNNLYMGFRNAGVALRTGRPVGNVARTSLDFLDTKAMQEAQGELIPSGERSGYTINYPNISPEFAETSAGKLFTALWRGLATPGARLAVGIDSFNSTVAGWSYEYFRHVPRGMELAVDSGLTKMSPEAFDYAYKYAQRRVDDALTDAVIDGKTFSDVALESPHAQKFMDAVNFTDEVMAELEPRTVKDGFERGKARGLEGEELTKFANDWVEKGDWTHRVAETAMNSWVPFGRFGSAPGLLLTGLAEIPVVGPVVKFVQPFMRVPTNIFKTALRSSPAAPFVDTFWRDITSSDIGTRQRAMGQVVIGSSALGLITMATNLGRVRINGSGPTDPKAFQKWIKDRQIQNSFQFWNDEEGYWDAPVSLAAMEPFATLFQAIGDYNDVQAMLPQAEKNRLGEALVLDLIQLTLAGQLSKSYYQGIQELVEVFTDPRKIFTGPNRIGARNRALQRAIATMLPLHSMLKQSRKVYDPVPRGIEPALDAEGNPEAFAFWKETWATTVNLIPGYSEDNPAIIDWSAPGGPPVHAPSLFFSREMAENFPWMAWGLQFVPPIAAFGRGRMITDPVHQEMANLHGTGTSFLGPQAIDFGKEGEVYLTPGELNEYRKIFATVVDETGRTWHQSVLLLLKSKAYELARQTDIKEEATRKKGEVPHRAALIQMEITKFKGLAKEKFELTVPKGIQIREIREDRENRNNALEVIKQSGGYDSSNANFDLLQLNV